MESQTLSSSPDDRGHSYWVSFSNASFAKGTTSNAHKGILNGTGPRSGEKAIVKAFRDEAGTEERCDLEITKSEKAQELACLFRRKFLEHNQCLTFPKPMKALMDHVALINALTFSRRKLSGQEWVLIEHNMGKKFQIFGRRNGEVKKTIHPALTAFMHFTYHHTNGELIVCGLKGIAHEKGWTFKIPTIHSFRSEFGLSDCGESGILQVLSKHECNYICEGMMLPSLSQRRQQTQLSPLISAQIHSAPVPMLQRQASAPYDPEVVYDPASPMLQGYLVSPPPYLLHQQDHIPFYHPGMDCCESQFPLEKYAS